MFCIVCASECELADARHCPVCGERLHRAVGARAAGGDTRELDSALGRIMAARRDRPSQVEVANATPAAVGDLIDQRFRLTRTIGSGSQADVFEATDEIFGGLYAIKVFQRAEFDLERAMQEVEVVRKIDRFKHVVRIYELRLDFARALYFLSMELLEGQSLADALTPGTPMPLAEALTVLKETCLGLQALHEVGVVHRDIKAENLFITRSGHVKLMDFGIAKPLARSGMRRKLVKTEGALGTPHYISPEQLDKRAEPRSDIYSLGVLAYLLATGRFPFDAETIEGVLLMHLSQVPPAPRELNPEVPAALSAVIMRMLAKNPDDRPASALEVYELLAQMKVAPLAAPAVDQFARTEWPSGVRRPERRKNTFRRKRLLMLSAIIAASVLGTAALLNGGVDAVEAAAPEQEPPSASPEPVVAPPPIEQRQPSPVQEAKHPVLALETEPAPEVEGETTEAAQQRAAEEAAARDFLRPREHVVLVSTATSLRGARAFEDNEARRSCFEGLETRVCIKRKLGMLAVLYGSTGEPMTAAQSQRAAECMTRLFPETRALAKKATTYASSCLP